MHKIRNAAHKRARIFREGDPPYTKITAFRSSTSSAKPRDLESGLGGAANTQRRDYALDGDHQDYTLSPTQTADLDPNGKTSDCSKTVVADSPTSPTTRVDAEKQVDHHTSTTQNDPNPVDGARPRKRDRFTGMFKKKGSEDKDLERTTTSESKSKSKQHYTIWGQVKVVIFGSWINVLLICVPLGIAFEHINISPYATFAVNFLAIVPLAGILSYATEEIALRVGETLGGLLNASFGNAVELIVSIIALTQGKIIIVQTSLIGSILSNLLLVMGMCFFFGGMRRIEQFFNVTVAQTAASLLALAVGSLIIPTCFHRFGTGGTLDERATKIPQLSRGIAIILLLMYLAYLYFQLSTHSDMFNDTGGAATTRKPSAGDEGSIKQAVATMGAGHAGLPGDSSNKQIFNSDAHQEKHKEEDEDVPQLSVYGAIFTLCAATAFVGVCSEYMVSGIAPVAQYISPEFIGLILIPIVGNAAEHATAVTVAIKDKMDLAIGVAVGSSMQIALFVLPFVVIIGWIIGQDAMTLEFDGFLITIVFVAVLLVNYLIGDGKSHWLEGVMLMLLYVIIAVAAYLYPADPSVVG